MRWIEWESENGRVIRMSGIPYLLASLNDTLGADAQIVKAPGQDGATTYGVTLGQPVVNIMGTVNVTGQTPDDVTAALERAEDELKRAFMPNRFGTLIDHRFSGDRQIRCRPLAKPVMGRRLGNCRTFDIELVADMPLWESVLETTEELGQERGRFRFPLRLPTKMGLYRKNAVIDNGSGEDIHPVIEIFTTSAFISVSNETHGQWIQVNRPIEQGQKMIIDMRNTRAERWMLGENNDWEFVDDVSHWVDGEYWTLRPGINLVTLNNERQGDTVIALLRFRVPM